MSKVGRNDPCPCGSGKKFKFCHGDSANLPFPEDQTFLESLGKPNGATDLLKQVKAAMGEQVFADIAEAEAFMSQFMTQHNAAAKEDFLGLSSIQMGDILNRPPEEASSIVSIDYSALDEAVPNTVPILEAARWLLTRLEAQPIKLTSAGYLPPSIAVPWWEDSLGPSNFSGRDFPDPVKKEGDRLLMGELRRFFTELGWTKVRTGTLSITKKGSQFLAANLRDQYREAYRGVSETLDWGIVDHPYFAPNHPMMQDSWLFNLHILRKAGDEGITCDDAADLWLKAFPLILEDYSLAGDGLESTREQGVKSTVSSNCFYYFPRLLGLIEFVSEESKSWFAARKVKLSPLANALHRWKV